MNEALEKAIDDAGRDKVFARARSYGWDSGGAPEFIWWGIVREVKENRPPPYELTKQTGVLDFLWR